MQLATNNLYCDFILLDPCDAAAVNEFLKDDKSVDRQHGNYRGSSLISKAHKSFLSPARHSGGTARKSSVKKGLDNFGQASPLGGASKNPNNDFEAGPSNNIFSDHGNCGFESDDNNPQHEDFDDSDCDGDDPWKPLNPHEPGNLKVKPFRKGSLNLLLVNAVKSYLGVAVPDFQFCLIFNVKQLKFPRE